MTMFPYDSVLIAALQTPPRSIPDVLRALQTIDATCKDGDGLKWFNRLYLQVTTAVQDRVTSGGFNDPTSLRELDVQFGQLFFSSLRASLLGSPCPGCWSACFDVRNDARISRLQFALAGVNAHINHDLPEALVTTATLTGHAPMHGSVQHQDYLALNTTLDSLIDDAKRTLNVRLLGGPMPAVSHVEDAVAAWGVSAARTQAWDASEVLWALRNSPSQTASVMKSLDGLTSVISKGLLIPAP